MKTFIKRELEGWKPLEIAWLVLATAVILGVSLYWQENAIGMTASLTGVWCVILSGKGKLSAYIVGTVNTVAYAYIAFGAALYGEVMLNLLYYLPTNVIGWFMWKNHVSDDSGEVVKRKMPLKTSLPIYGLVAVAVFLYGLLLKYLGGDLAFIDSTTTVLSVVAQLFLIKRLAEQWIMWIVVDAVSVVMWGIKFSQGGENIATLLMWSVFLINAVIMYVKWYKEAKRT